MSLAIVVYVLTALAAAVVVLTRRRLGASTGAARLELPRSPVQVHTVAGSLALVSWVGFLLTGDRLGESAATLIGLFALACWWVTVLAGLLLLSRWLPTHGKHAGPGSVDTWSDGPGLSILAHVGLLVGVLVFTYAYLVSAV